MIGMDLFTGYGGITMALEGYVTPIIYCEKEKYAQGIILSRMEDGTLPFAPIWDDVTTLDGKKFKGLVDIIYGGFPCQDISVAGTGRGLGGERSGLFKEIIRLAQEVRPGFLFLENVPAIRTRGAEEVQRELSRLGFDTRWGTFSAAEVGANHRRERWFCLAAHPDRLGLRNKQVNPTKQEGPSFTRNHGPQELVAHSDMQGCGREASATTEEDNQGERQGDRWSMSPATDSSWWEIEPPVGRVVDGYPLRPHELKALGNGVVPLQVRRAWEVLTGLRPI